MQHFIKKAAALAMAMVMALSLASVAFAADFDDMPDDWSTTALEAAVEHGLLSGKDGKIAAGDTLTRAELATIITRAFGATVEDDVSAYADIRSDAWYKSAVAKAVHMGAMSGVSATAMEAANPISRQQVFIVLARVLKLADGDAADLAAFSDASDVASWAVPSVAAMVKGGYVSGSNGAINPKGNITRAEFAQLMYNIFNNAYISEAGTYEEVNGKNVIISSTNVTLKGVDVEGDVVVADGVGDGDVFFDDVTIGGRLVVRGGGMNSIHFKNSKAPSAVMAKVDGNVRLVVEGESTVGTVSVEAGKASTDVRVEGVVGKVVVNDAASTVVLADATVEAVEVNAANATVSLAGATKVAEMTVAAGATKTTVNAEPNTEIAKLETAEDVFINNEDAIKDCNDESKINPEGEEPTDSAAPSASSAPGASDDKKDHVHTFETETVDQNGTPVVRDKASKFDANRHSFECSVCHELVLRPHDAQGDAGACSVCGQEKAVASDATLGDVTQAEKRPEGVTESCAADKHTWTTEKVDQTGATPYNCVSGGTENVKCSTCWDTSVVTLSATKAHTFNGAETDVTAATCAAAGSKKVTCSVCGNKSEAMTIAKLDHKTGNWVSDGSDHWKVCANTTVHETEDAQKVEKAAHTWKSASASQHACTVCGKKVDHSFDPSTHKCACGAEEGHEYKVEPIEGNGTQHKMVCTYEDCATHPDKTVNCTFNKPGHKCECSNTDTDEHIAAAAKYTQDGVGYHKVTCSIADCSSHTGEKAACTYNLKIDGTADGDVRCACGQLKTAHKLSTAWSQVAGDEKHTHYCVCGDTSCAQVTAETPEACTYTLNNGTKCVCGRIKPCEKHTVTRWTPVQDQEKHSGACTVCGATVEGSCEFEEVAGSAVAANCKEAGHEANKKCTTCSNVKEGTSIPATGNHSWKDDSSAAAGDKCTNKLHDGTDCGEPKPEADKNT